jgi:hypothetical protein
MTDAELKRLRKRRDSLRARYAALRNTLIRAYLARRPPVAFSELPAQALAIEHVEDTFAMVMRDLAEAQAVSAAAAAVNRQRALSRKVPADARAVPA